VQGYLTVSLHDTYYQAAAARFPDEVPPLTQAQQAAMALFNATADRDDVRLDYWLEPGDMQFVNNHNIVHTRSQFEDWQVGTSLVSSRAPTAGAAIDNHHRVWACMALPASECGFLIQPPLSSTPQSPAVIDNNPHQAVGCCPTR
jgi:hypothetical protein